MLSTPGPGDLEALDREMRGWPVAPARAALHVGDLGWNHQFGAAGLAESLRVWWRGETAVAVGLLEDGGLARLAVAPDLRDDEDLAHELAADLATPGRVLPGGVTAVEARAGGRLPRMLTDEGWEPDEPWTPLVRDLAEPVPEHHLRVEEVGPDRVADRVAVHRASFERSTFTAERWRALVSGPAHRHARSIVGYDDRGDAVAMVTVWAAGGGGPGLLEPMGVHHAHRGRGHGRAICLAAASALQDLGASHAMVCTPSSNVGGVATYVAAGYDEQPQVRDLRRPA